MVNNVSYFRSVNFDPTDINSIPPPSDTVMYLRGPSKWSVRDLPPGNFEKGKVIVSNNTFNKLPADMKSQVINQAAATMSSDYFRDDERSDYSISDEHQVSDEHDGDTVESPDEPDEPTDPTVETIDKPVGELTGESTKHPKHYMKIKKMLKKSDEKQLKKIHNITRALKYSKIAKML